MSGNRIAFNSVLPTIRPHGPGIACPTVRIKVPVTAGNPDGITEINASDYDKDKHELVDSGVPAELVDTSVANAIGMGGSALLHSSKHDKPLVIIKGEPVEIGIIVVAAFEKSKLSNDAWNKLTDDERAALIDGEIFARS